MMDLFRSELRRFRLTAILAALAHLLALQFMSRTSNLLQQSYFESAPLLGAYLLIGLALALVQVGGYRKPSQWLWLIHRPLSTLRIFMALALSALTLLALVVVLPQLVLVATLDVFTTQVVDMRHYLWLPHVLALVLMAWLAGCHAILSRNRAAIAVLAVPPLFAVHLVSVGWLLLPMLACLLWLGYIAAASVRANREAPPRRAATLLLTALPLQLGLFLLIFKIGQTVFVTGSILLGVDPLNTEYPPEGGLIEIQRKTPAEALQLGLTNSPDARAASWREQLPLLEPVSIGEWLQRFPIRHQFSNLALPNSWYDEPHHIQWTFSHDRMLFRGRDPKSGTDRGWWGIGGSGDQTPFTEVPIIHENNYLLTRNTLYVIDHDAQRLHRQLQLDRQEWFIGLPSAQLGHVLVLSNRHLLAYRPDRDATDLFAPLKLDWQLPLPHGPSALVSVHLAELMDGWLVSFLYGDGMRQIGFSQFTSLAEPHQQVLFIDAEGHARTVDERTIKRDYPLLYESSWWLSPPLHVLSEWPESLVEKGLTWPLEPTRLPASPIFYGMAGALMLSSLLLGFWWLRGTQLPTARRRLWLASCALIGLPALLSLICLEPRSARA